MTDSLPNWQTIADRLWLFRRFGWALVRENEQRVTILSLYVPALAALLLLLVPVVPFVWTRYMRWIMEAVLLAGLGVLLGLGGDFWLLRIGKQGNPSTIRNLPLFFRGARPLKARGFLVAGKELWLLGWLRRLRPLRARLAPGVAGVFLVQENLRTSLLRQRGWSGFEVPEPWGSTEPAVALARQWANYAGLPLVLRPGAGLPVDIFEPRPGPVQNLAELDYDIMRAARAVLEEGVEPEPEPHPDDEPVGELVEIDPVKAEQELQEVMPPPPGVEGKDSHPA